MRTVFVSQHLWPQLAKAARACHQRCAVAVAYFGKGASRLLPLRRGSRLVVDASERTVAAGLTCPADLLKLMKRGVLIYSVPNLHAKVFVLGRVAFIGSANVSSRSAAQLIEAQLRTTEVGAVRAARQFVYGNCLHELTPTVLKRLARLYRPPRIPGGKPKKRRNEPPRPSLPRLLLAQLEPEAWSDSDWALHDSGLAVASRRRRHRRSFELDSFRMVGRCRYSQGDVVVQLLDEGGGTVLASPPANVLYVRHLRSKRGHVSFVYLERPVRRRRRLEVLAKQMGRGSRKLLQRDGVVRNAAFAQALLNAWTS
jgi:hypothetical protein